MNPLIEQAPYPRRNFVTSPACGAIRKPLNLDITRCRRDLADPALDHLPVSAIGGRWGFSDPAHFSHTFKAAYGISPREARTDRTAAARSAPERLVGP